jgi:ligand-binding SRPBCC domain-containing protein
VRGPYRRWHHTHEFIEAEGGTLMRDTVEYAIPYGPLGRLAHALLVKRWLRRIFDYRRDVLERRFG